MSIRRALLPLGLLALAATARAQPPAALSAPRDLPVVELPPTAAPNGTPNGAPAHGPGDSTLVVFLTGDGDWAEIDAGVAAVLRGTGMGVVGLESRKYLRGATRTPDIAARDVARLIAYYGAAWRRPRIVLVGYSRGADMLPFVATRLPAEQRARLDLVAMLGLANAASFEFHWSDVVSDRSRPTDLPVLPELARLRGTRLLCVYGADETDSGCRAADPSLIERVERPGAHHFDKDYAALGALLVRASAAGRR